MKFNFNKIPKTKTMGLRLTIDDYEKISKLAKTHNTSRVGIVSEIVKTSLKEIKG